MRSGFALRPVVFGIVCQEPHQRMETLINASTETELPAPPTSNLPLHHHEPLNVFSSAWTAEYDGSLTFKREGDKPKPKH